MKILSICQPHFFPWIGYFNMIENCDEFIFLDNVQYNRRSWQNRVYIMDSKKLNKKWLTMPLRESSRKFKINEVFLSKNSLEIFKNQLFENYRDTKFFEDYFELFSKILEKNIEKNLSEINICIIKEICKLLDINLTFKKCSQFSINKKKEYLILSLLKISKSANYLANDGSTKYADASFFDKNKIKMRPHNFKHPFYFQSNLKSHNFVKGLSILDLLFNKGEDSISLVKNQRIKF